MKYILKHIFTLFVGLSVSVMLVIAPICKAEAIYSFHGYVSSLGKDTITLVKANDSDKKINSKIKLTRSKLPKSMQDIIEASDMHTPNKSRHLSISSRWLAHEF
jgi:hypothetical protein